MYLENTRNICILKLYFINLYSLKNYESELIFFIKINNTKDTFLNCLHLSLPLKLSYFLMYKLPYNLIVCARTHTY